MCFRTVILAAAQGGLEWCFVAPDVLEAQRSLRRTRTMASPPDIPIELFWREAKGKKAPRRRPCSGAARRRRHLGQGMEWTGDGMDRVWTLTPLEMKEEVSRLSPEFLACASRWNGWHFEMRTLSTMGCWGGKGLNCRYQPPIPTWLASPHTLWLHRAGGRA